MDVFYINYLKEKNKRYIYKVTEIHSIYLHINLLDGGSGFERKRNRTEISNRGKT